MRGDALARDLGKVGMRIGRQRIGEQPVDPRTAELSRRQADAVHDDEIGLDAAGRESQFGERTWRASRSTPLEGSTCNRVVRRPKVSAPSICDNRPDMNAELATCG